jgi:hypothetical protein
VATVGALEALLRNLGNPAVTREPTEQRFRLADGTVTKALSKVNVPSGLGTLQVYVIRAQGPADAAPGPVLLGTRSLQALQTQIDYMNRRIAFRAAGGNYVRQLTQNPRGHILLDIGDSKDGLVSGETGEASEAQAH